MGDRTLTAGTEYNYNPGTGELLIPAEYVTGNITISATAEASPEYTIYFVYETSPGREEQVVEREIQAGDHIPSPDDIIEEIPETRATSSVGLGYGEGNDHHAVRDIWVIRRLRAKPVYPDHSLCGHGRKPAA